MSLLPHNHIGVFDFLEQMVTGSVDDNITGDYVYDSNDSSTFELLPVCSFHC